jgi:hypothetical protein
VYNGVNKLEEDNPVAETKYGNCVKTLPVHQMKERDMELMSIGAKDMNGLNVHIIYAYAYETGITGMSKKPHVHTYDEAVFFIGSDPRHFSDLGAEVEMSIGAEEEKHTFNKATVVVLPAGVPHCPIVTKSITRPYLCMAVSMTGHRED